MRPLGFNLGTRGWDMGRVMRGGGVGGGFRDWWLGLGHGVGLTDRWVAGTGTWGGLRGQTWWIGTRESDLQGLTWGHGTGTRVW